MRLSFSIRFAFNDFIVLVFQVLSNISRIFVLRRSLRVSAVSRRTNSLIRKNNSIFSMPFCVSVELWNCLSRFCFLAGRLSCSLTRRQGRLPCPRKFPKDAESQKTQTQYTTIFFRIPTKPQGNSHMRALLTPARGGCKVRSRIHPTDDDPPGTRKQLARPGQEWHTGFHAHFSGSV